ncbi:endoglucanase [Dyadobacter sp. BE34]|uniref:Endoglucanase n=1 Tax=Dyadobacter fermentans TaxID=94254 RepID=A0ABU1R7Z4_9BACT|nr:MULTISPECIES: glycoside hydrolase family 9 protein [Dyadobacter]MDR6809034.1 endoglucanase [Dyadobacter fermentans]MDR7046777.1 endoglucanase [Dyadobacter sp. BE242]MDR7201091.1 endoglucanase [Dyadobacter sp. BE34]MDR7219051.1 endoglucanase [Dyadobacter sp. BE31]MDR7264739.1 endoglucanase [Dyadobacter sp. BE32]
MKLLPRLAALLAAVSLYFSPACAQQHSDAIRLNQVGFYPAAPKVAVIVTETGGAFEMKEAKSGKTVLKGALGDARTSQHSGKHTRLADFSAVRKPGTYVIEIAGLGKSAAFAIGGRVHRNVAEAALKGFYYQRASIDLPEKYAGKWARPAGHPDEHVLIHASAVSDGRPENTVISSPRGWYDAGDYNKYIVNSGITMGTLLSLYEDYPLYFEDFNTNIPESNNGVPDLLDEVVWNLRWMLTMQDPADGGVYHKLTNPRFDGTIMPDAAKNPRYVVQKGTAATLDLVAVMAQASRIFKNFDNKFPGLADSCATAAVKGWQWAQKHPEVIYNQGAMNKEFDPDVATGAYGDRSVKDEWIWAACEMYATTGKPEYIQNIDLELQQPMALPTWSQVKTLGYYTLLRSAQTLKLPVGQSEALRKNILSYAGNLVTDLETQPFHTVMGKTAQDYAWGSSSVAANQGIALLYAYRLSNDKKYLHAALDNLDYLLGRNATGYCFLTGFGSKRVMHPHHRLSMADGVADPVPGLLSGGPNPGQQDKCAGYPNKFADESFTDSDCSYASNEIAINWNAPMVYLATALEATMK